MAPPSIAAQAIRKIVSSERSIPLAPSAAGKSMGRTADLNPRQPSSCLSLAVSSLSRIGKSSAIWRQLAGVGIEEISLAPGAGHDRRDQLLANRVQRRVRDLREQLLEIVEKRLGAVGEDGQGGVGPHRAERLLAVVAHRARG